MGSPWGRSWRVCVWRLDLGKKAVQKILYKPIIFLKGSKSKGYTDSAVLLGFLRYFYHPVPILYSFLVLL